MSRRHIHTRRSAIKAAGAAGIVGAIGLGAAAYRSQPVAAASSDVTENDVVIETVDGGVSKLGVSDLWFELEYEHIRYDLRCYPRFYHEADGVGIEILADTDLGITGEGSETYGFGREYADLYNVNLGVDEHFGETPIYTEDEDWLDPFQLADDEHQKTISVELQIGMADREEDGTQGQAFIDTLARFDVIVDRVSADAEVVDGAARVFGEE